MASGKITFMASFSTGLHKYSYSVCRCNHMYARHDCLKKKLSASWESSFFFSYLLLKHRPSRKEITTSSWAPQAMWLEEWERLSILGLKLPWETSTEFLWMSHWMQLGAEDWIIWPEHLDHSMELSFSSSFLLLTPLFTHTHIHVCIHTYGSLYWDMDVHRHTYRETQRLCISKNANLPYLIITYLQAMCLIMLEKIQVDNCIQMKELNRI